MSPDLYTIVLIIIEMAFSLMLVKTLCKAGAAKSLLAVISAVWAVWLATVYLLLSNGFFTATGMPQLSFTLGVALPIIVYWLAVYLYQPLKQTVNTMTTQNFLSLQLWRAPFGVMFFFTSDLPTWFQYVGGLGDIAAGVGAFFALNLLRKQPDREYQAIIRGNLVGILDFIVVINLGVFVVLADHSPDIMFDLIPLYVVPLFILLHVYSLQRLGRAGRSA